MKKLLIVMLSFVFIIACKSKDTAVEETEYKAKDRADRSQRGNRNEPRSIDDIFQMDGNGDGFLSKDELKGPLLRDFEKIDTDQDGMLSREEVENAPRPERRQRGGQRGN